MVPDTLFPVAGKMTDGEDGDNHPTVELPAMVPTILSLLEDFPYLLSARADLVILPKDQEFHEAGSSKADCMTYLRKSFTS